MWAVSLLKRALILDPYGNSRGGVGPRAARRSEDHPLSGSVLTGDHDCQLSGKPATCGISSPAPSVFGGHRDVDSREDWGALHKTSKLVEAIRTLPALHDAGS